MKNQNDFSGQLYRRKDYKWAWRVVADNGKVVATDGQQGYERSGDASAIFKKLFPGMELKRYYGGARK